MSSENVCMPIGYFIMMVLETVAIANLAIISNNTNHYIETFLKSADYLGKVSSLRALRCFRDTLRRRLV